MRVLLVNKFARLTGGADRHCLDLAAMLEDDGHRVALLSTEDPRNERVPDYAVPLTVERETKAGLSAGRSAIVAASAAWSTSAHRAMRRALVEFRPDIVHAHKLYPQLSVSPLVAAHRAGAPIVQTLHDYEFLSADGRQPRRAPIDHTEPALPGRMLNTALFAQKRVLHRRLVDGWIAISSFVRDVHHRQGIEATVLEHFRVDGPRAWPDFGERDGVAFAGRLAREKGIDALLTLVAELPDVSFTVAGTGPMEGTVRRAAGRHDNLEFVGRLAEHAVLELFGGARVVVVPSQWEEPAGLVALEAMACGTPVVATDRGGLGEYVREADPDSVVTSTAAIGARIAALLGDSGLWQERSERGLATIATRHDPARYRERLLELYERARSARGAATTG